MSKRKRAADAARSLICVPVLKRHRFTVHAGWSLIGLVRVGRFLLGENQYGICEEFRDRRLHFDLLLTGLDLFRVLAGADLAFNQDRLTFLQVLGNLLAEVAPHNDAMPFCAALVYAVLFPEGLRGDGKVRDLAVVFKLGGFGVL